jgi:hypothetical protein
VRSRGRRSAQFDDDDRHGRQAEFERAAGQRDAAEGDRPDRIGGAASTRPVADVGAVPASATFSANI